MRHCAILLVLITFGGCSHSNTPPDAGTTPNALYSITGEVDQVFLGLSDFDTVNWTAATRSFVNLTGEKSAQVSTGLSGTFFFDSLSAGSYNISVDVKGYAPASLHVTEPDNIASSNVIHLFPISWLQATIDSVYPDADPTLGLDVRTHITSTDPAKPPMGSVYLFIDTNRAIDPQVPSSYDIVYILEVGNKKDSIIYENILPQLVHSTYAAGTHGFCKAYASPYAQQYTYYNKDSNNRTIYPYFGAHPGNTVSLVIP